MAQSGANPGVVRFGLFELHLDSRELRKSGVRIKLQEQPFLILALLVERPGAIVTREVGIAIGDISGKGMSAAL